jgi:hypothetical protein
MTDIAPLASSTGCAAYAPHCFVKRGQNPKPFLPRHAKMGVKVYAPWFVKGGRIYDSLACQGVIYPILSFNILSYPILSLDAPLCTVKRVYRGPMLFDLCSARAAWRQRAGHL